MVQITLTAAFVAFSAAVASAQISLPISLGSIPAACSGDCAGLSASAANANCLQESSCYCAGGFVGNALPCLHCVKAAEPTVFGDASPNNIVQGIVEKCAGVAVTTSAATTNGTSAGATTGSSTGTNTSAGITTTASTVTTSTVATTSPDKTAATTSSRTTSSSSSGSASASASPTSGAIAVSQNVFAVLAAVGLGSAVLL